VIGVHTDTEAHTQDALLARRQRSQDTRRRLHADWPESRIERQYRVLVFDEIAEIESSSSPIGVSS